MSKRRPGRSGGSNTVPNPGANPNLGPQNLNTQPIVDPERQRTGEVTATGREIFADSQDRKFFDGSRGDRLFLLPDVIDKSDKSWKDYAVSILQKLKEQETQIKGQTLDDVARDQALQALADDALESRLVREEEFASASSGTVKRMKIGYIDSAWPWFRDLKNPPKAASATVPNAAPNPAPVPTPNHVPQPSQPDQATVERIAKEVAVQAARELLDAATAEKAARKAAKKEAKAERRAAEEAAEAARVAASPTASFDALATEYEDATGVHVNRGVEETDILSGQKTKKNITMDQIRALATFAASKSRPPKLDDKGKIVEIDGSTLQGRAELATLEQGLIAQGVIGRSDQGEPMSRDNTRDKQIMDILTKARKQLGMEDYLPGALVQEKSLPELTQAEIERKKAENWAEYSEQAQAAGGMTVHSYEYQGENIEGWLDMKRREAYNQAYENDPAASWLGKLWQVYENELAALKERNADSTAIEALRQTAVDTIRARRQWYDGQNKAAEGLWGQAIAKAEQRASAVVGVIDAKTFKTKVDLNEAAAMRAKKLGAGEVETMYKAGGRFHLRKKNRGPKVIVTVRPVSPGSNAFLVEQRSRNNGELLSQMVSTSKSDFRTRKRWGNLFGREEKVPPKDVVAMAANQRRKDARDLLGKNADKFWRNTFKRDYVSGFGTGTFRDEVYGGVYGQDPKERGGRLPWFFKITAGR